MDVRKCSSCEQFNIGDMQAFLNYVLKIPGDNKNITNIGWKDFTCHMCCQNKTLTEHVQELNETISRLHSRINSLSVIRSIEFDIDDISKQFSEISVNSQNDTYIPIAASETHSIVNTTATSVNTTIWDSSQNDTSRMSHESVHLSYKEKETQTESVEKVIQELQTSVTESNHLKEQEFQTIPTLHEIITADKSVNKDMSSSPFSKVNTLLIGDRSIEHIKLDVKHHTLKIARSNTNAQQLIETTNFYLEKFPDIKQIVFQVVHSDMIEKGSEELKKQYSNLIDTARGLGVKLIFSGPIPDPNMKSECFSRASYINDWLIEQEKNGSFGFVDNFASFWNKSYLFQSRSSFLGNNGILKLQSAITSTLDC